MQHRLRCAEVWGGVSGQDVDAESYSLRASLFSLPAEGTAGGDLYYFSVCANDRLTRFAVADVVGHGQTVSTVSGWMYDALRGRMNSLDGGGVLRDLNRLATGRGLKAMTTAAVAAFYKTNGQCYLAYAGHHEMLLLRSGEAIWQPVQNRAAALGEGAANLPLGVLEESTYEQERFPLGAGDRVALYTDGLIEAPDASGDLFGLERLRAVLDEDPTRSPREVKLAVLETVRDFTGGSLAHDDVTLLVAEMR